MAKVVRGTRITGAQRETLAAQYAKKYESGQSIRKIAETAGRSFGFVHGVLVEHGVTLRGRGGATRGAKRAASGAAKKASTAAPAKAATRKTASKTVPAAKKTAAKKASATAPTKKTTTKKAPAKTAPAPADGEGSGQEGRDQRDEVGCGQEDGNEVTTLSPPAPGEEVGRQDHRGQQDRGDHEEGSRRKELPPRPARRRLPPRRPPPGRRRRRRPPPRRAEAEHGTRSGVRPPCRAGSS